MTLETLTLWRWCLINLMSVFHATKPKIVGTILQTHETKYGSGFWREITQTLQNPPSITKMGPSKLISCLGGALWVFFKVTKRIRFVEGGYGLLGYSQHLKYQSWKKGQYNIEHFRSLYRGLIGLYWAPLKILYLSIYIILNF